MYVQQTCFLKTSNKENELVEVRLVETHLAHNHILRPPGPSPSRLPCVAVTAAMQPAALTQCHSSSAGSQISVDPTGGLAPYYP